jgi:hypothetical protein
MNEIKYQFHLEVGKWQNTALTLIIPFLPRNPGAGTGSDSN